MSEICTIEGHTPWVEWDHCPQCAYHRSQHEDPERYGQPDEDFGCGYVDPFGEWHDS